MRFDHDYSPRHDLADRLRNRFDVESYDVYEFHGDNTGNPDSGASDDQTSVSGAAGASTSLPDCAPDDPACHPHRVFQSFQGYPGYGPSVPPGYPHGPFVEPDMGTDGFGYIPPPPAPGGYRPPPPSGVFGRIQHHLRALGGGFGGGGGGGGGYQPPAPPYGGGAPFQGIGQPGVPPPPQTSMNSFQRWIQVHGMSPTAHQDWINWWNQFGQSGATINGEGSSFGDDGSDLCGGFDMKG